MSTNWAGEDTIVAMATGEGQAAISVIRVSGKNAWNLADEIFRGKKKRADWKANHAYFGNIEADGEILDEIIMLPFKAPYSFTGEDLVEFSIHGSPYIRRSIQELLIKKGARTARPGEFTQRAFMHGKMDLSQAEAIADLIASESSAAHKVAMHQVKGGFANTLRTLRQGLMDFASLVELELDFAEENVEFANREQLKNQVENILRVIQDLRDSFRMGNVIKKGVPVAIAGKPNAGKSTLLNALLGEEKAIVSAIPGTTRDVIEDTLNIEGILFRIIDTAGIRENPDNEIEKIGIERTFEKMQSASLILYIWDATEKDLQTASETAQNLQQQYPESKIILVANKMDQQTVPANENTYTPLIYISAKEQQGLENLKQFMLEFIIENRSFDSTVVTNIRHYEALSKAAEYLQKVMDGLNSGLSGDLLAMDIRQSLYHLGEITGEITADDLLGNIFSRFCIGK